FNLLPKGVGEFIVLYLLPGIFFGAVLWWAFRRRIGITLAKGILVLSLTTVAWFCAVQSTGQSFTAWLFEFLKPEWRFTAWYGMVGGLVGSVVLCVGLRTLVSEQLKVRAIVRTVMIGVIAGVFLQFMDKSYLPLFLVWQPSVAASLVRGLGAAKESI